MIYRKILARVGGIGGYLAQSDHAPGLIVSKQTPVTATTWAQAAHALFTVTGDVIVHWCVGIVDVAMVGAATVAVGVAGQTAVLIASITDVGTKLASVNDVYAGRGEASYGRYAAEVDGGGVFLSGTIDIDIVSSAADITAGQMTFYVCYTAVSADGKIAAAVWD
jgi:hypothetical protein